MLSTGQRSALVDRIDALLPQTQCTRCGFPTCRAYADAIAIGTADIDRCPPGGADGVAALAHLLDVATKPLDPAYGVEAPPIVALIDEEVCIGCTKCIQACPVDAIVGAAKRMHTVITAECTGCELCLPPCPVDCIALVPIAVAPLSRAGVLERAAMARARFEARNARKQPAGTRAPAESAAGAAVAGAAQAAMLSSGRGDAVATRSIAASAAPTIAAAITSTVAKDESRVAEGAPAGSSQRPIDRAAVLAAIARGKARRAAKDPDA